MALPAILGALGRAAAGGGALGRGAAAGGGTFGSALGQVAGTAFNLQQVGGAAKAAGNFLVDALTPGVQQMKLFAMGVNAVNAPMKSFVGGLKSLHEAFTSLGNGLSEFVKLASPIHVVKFQMAADDLAASMGKFLIPMMEFATKQVRAFADVVFTLSDPLTHLMKAVFDPLTKMIDTMIDDFSPLIMMFGDFIDTLAKMAEPVMTILIALNRLNPIVLAFNAFASVLDALSDPITTLMNYTQALAMVFNDLAKEFANFIDEALKFIGLGGTKGPSIRDKSVGAAVRPAQFGSLEDYGKRAQQAAFSLGTAADPAKETSKTVLDIYNWLKTDLPNEFKAWAARLPDELAAALAKVIPGGETVRAAIPAIAETGRDAGRWVERRADEVREAASGVLRTLGLD